MFCATEGFLIRVADLAPARDFYGRILQLPLLVDTPERLVFHIPDGRIYVEYDPDATAPAGSGARPILMVEDIDSAVFHFSRCGVRFLSGIESRGGLWICEIADPYGNALAVAQSNEVREKKSPGFLRGLKSS
ncbi:MAG: hypothetical protein HRF49_03450 [bacterium]